MTENLRAKFEHLKIRLANEQETSTQRGTVLKEYMVENERLKKQLAVAVETLEAICDDSGITDVRLSHIGNRAIASKALKQIEELSK